MFKEFKAFIARGNVLDLAVAVIIGTAFGAIVTSLTDYAALKEAGAAVIGYGAFVTALINFVILAFVIFLLVRAANRLIAKKEEAPAGPTDIELLTEIRDELRKRG